MKKLLFSLSLILLLLFSACSPFHWEADGTNVKIYSEDEATVYFYPVCPDCGHVSPMYSVNLSSGESHETFHQCESCWGLYDVIIHR